MFLKQLLNLLSILTEENLMSLVSTVAELHGVYVVQFNDGSDVAIHSFTYGSDKGLWESYRMPQDGEDVSGWLTPEDIVARLKTNFNL